MNPWKHKEINILRSGVDVEAMLKLLPGRTAAAIRHQASKLGVVLLRSIRSRSKWEAWELLILESGAPMEDITQQLPLRSPSSIRARIKSEPVIKSKAVKAKLQVEVKVGWDEYELEIIARDASAGSLVRLLPGRSVWTINHERRRRNMDRPSIGRRTLLVSDFDKVDWSRSVSSVARQAGVSRTVAARLKRQAFDK